MFSTKSSHKIILFERISILQNVKKIRRIVIISLFVLSALIILIGIGCIVTVSSETKLDKTKLPNCQTIINAYDRNGDRISDDKYVKISDISEDIQNAFIAVEDKRFYSHTGIDPIRILGATVKNLKSGSFSQGASTITCQLVKNTQLNGEKTLKRKWKEAVIAEKLEKIYFLSIVWQEH